MLCSCGSQAAAGAEFFYGSRILTDPKVFEQMYGAACNREYRTISGDRMNGPEQGADLGRICMRTLRGFCLQKEQVIREHGGVAVVARKISEVVCDSPVDAVRT